LARFWDIHGYGSSSDGVAPCFVSINTHVQVTDTFGNHPVTGQEQQEIRKTFGKLKKKIVWESGMAEVWVKIGGF
jgi:hypothetical protein